MSVCVRVSVCACVRVCVCVCVSRVCYCCCCSFVAKAGFEYIPLVRNLVRFLVGLLFYWQKYFYWSAPPS